MYLLSAVIQAAVMGYVWVLALYSFLLRGLEEGGWRLEQKLDNAGFPNLRSFLDEVKKAKKGLMPWSSELKVMWKRYLSLEGTREWMDTVRRVSYVVTVLATCVIIAGMIVLGYGEDNELAVWGVVVFAGFMFIGLGGFTLVVLRSKKEGIVE